MLLVCCFCDKVREESISHTHWRDLQVYVMSRTPKREDTILSYTCCDECLQGDPRAVAFRSRQSQSSASLLPPGTRPRRSVAA